MKDELQELWDDPADSEFYAQWLEDRKAFGANATGLRGEVRAMESCGSG